MTDLSLAAQAVLDASSDAPVGDGWNADRLAIAAALRAVADQLQMGKALGDTDADAGVLAAHQAIYGYITAIADELDGTQ